MNTGPEGWAASGSLPPVVSNYLAASDRDDIDAIVACFTEDAVVLDEDRHWVGAAAIRQWRENVATAFEYTVAIIRSEALGEVDGAQRHDVYTSSGGQLSWRPGGSDQSLHPAWRPNHGSGDRAHRGDVMSAACAPTSRRRRPHRDSGPSLSVPGTATLRTCNTAQGRSGRRPIPLGFLGLPVVMPG